MRISRTAVGVVASLALVVVACGDDDGAGSTTTSTPTTERTTGEDLDRLLLQAEDADGFAPAGSPLRFSSLQALVEEYGLPAADEQRLLDHGFEAGATYMLTGPSGAAGISAVDVFESEDGAGRELAHLVDNKEADAPPGVENFVRFDVPGVPTAVGWTFDKPGGHTAADVHWSQGRCVMSLGSEPPLVEELRDAVKAVYDRTGGACP